MLVVQNEFRPGEIQNALFDLMRPGIDTVRVCSAYVTWHGTQILFDGIRRAAPNGDHEGVQKIVVASLDFGITEPRALTFWRDTPNSQVFVAGTDLLERGNLAPSAAFHPKLYVFGRMDGTLGSLVGSPNLTSRALSVNCEVAWADQNVAEVDPWNRAWNDAFRMAVPLTTEILNDYSALRQRTPTRQATEEREPLPRPPIGQPVQYRAFGDAEIDAVVYRQMWIQSRGMQGGAQTQLELPRGAHRFFGATYQAYGINRVRHIAEPILVSGVRVWRDRPLTWHGDNAMERINLPSQSMGGFAYTDSLILFRRIAANTFELRVYPWDSDSARAYVRASLEAGLVFRVGRNSNRLAGFIPELPA